MSSHPSIGDYVHTPRFLKVRIEAIFAHLEDAYACGYKEPTHLYDGEFKVLGKVLDEYHMQFGIVLNSHK